MTLVAVLLPCMLRSMAAPAYAEHRYVDTETLYGWCEPYALGNASVGRLCAGYISAISDILSHNISIHEHRACIPEHVTLFDLRAVVVKTFESRPKDADKDGHDWVAQAFAENYPCES